MDERVSLSLDPDESVILVAETGSEVEIRQAHLQAARLWAATLEHDTSTTRIPTPLTPAILDRIVSFLTHHGTEPFSAIERPLRSCDLLDHGVSAWDLALVDLPDADLMALMHAANYIDCAPLLDLCGAKMATFLKNQSVANIRARFQIVNDLTPEEEKEIENEVQWAYEL